MNIRRRIPLYFAFVAALFITAPASASDIAAYARFQKAKTNTYDHEAKGFVVVFVGFSDDEAFEIFKQLPETNIVVRKDFPDAKEKSIVVGHNGIRIADITANYVEGVNKALSPPATPTTLQPSVFQSFQPYCPPGRT